jgi:hypothetical protein
MRVKDIGSTEIKAVQNKMNPPDFNSSPHSHSFLKPFGVAGVVAAALAFAGPAFASLGGNMSSIETDRTQMSASENVSHAANYEVHEIQSPAGTVVDEYVSSGGTVFAVTWHGQFPPQMQQILGNYFQQYTAALQAQPQRYGRGPLNIEQPGLVVQTGGHVRAHYGRVYVPSLLPAGVDLDQIK